MANRTQRRGRGPSLQNAAKDRRPPGGRSKAKAQVERRQKTVEQRLLEGATRAMIVNEVRQSFRASSRTVDADIAKVRQMWVAEGAVDRAMNMARAERRLYRLSRKLEAQKAFGALVKCEQLLLDLHGLRVQTLDIVADRRPMIVIYDPAKPDAESPPHDGPTFFFPRRDPLPAPETEAPYPLDEHGSPINHAEDEEAFARQALAAAALEPDDNSTSPNPDDEGDS